MASLICCTETPRRFLPEVAGVKWVHSFASTRTYLQLTNFDADAYWISIPKKDPQINPSSSKTWSLSTGISSWCAKHDKVFIIGAWTGKGGRGQLGQEYMSSLSMLLGLPLHVQNFVDGNHTSSYSFVTNQQLVDGSVGHLTNAVHLPKFWTHLFSLYGLCGLHTSSSEGLVALSSGDRRGAHRSGVLPATHRTTVVAPKAAPDYHNSSSENCHIESAGESSDSLPSMVETSDSDVENRTRRKAEVGPKHLQLTTEREWKIFAAIPEPLRSYLSSSGFQVLTDGEYV